MNHPVAYSLYEKYNENFEFCTRMYTWSTENGIEIVFNNQTVPILVLCVKHFVGFLFGLFLWECVWSLIWLEKSRLKFVSS